MWVFLSRRVLALPPLLLVVSFLTFLLLQAAPGDYYSRLEADPKFSFDYVMELRESAGRVIAVPPAKAAESLSAFRLGGREYAMDAQGRLRRDGAPADPRLEQAWIKRFEWPAGSGERWTVTETARVYRWIGSVHGYFVWLRNVVSGDLGESWSHRADVAGVISERMFNTLILEVVALSLAWGLAIPLGVWSGVRPNSAIDHLCGAIAYVSLSVPSVFLALLAVLLAYATGWFPIGNMRDQVLWDTFTPWEKVKDVAWHLVLPALIVGLTALAGFMRQMRSQMVETMSADYVRTARAKGVPRNRVIFRHALRNAINPLVTLFGFSIAALLSGSFLVEVVLNWPGLARVTVDAVFARDEPLVMASILMATLLLVFGNLVADVLLVLVDPRIRLN